MRSESLHTPICILLNLLTSSSGLGTNPSFLTGSDLIKNVFHLISSDQCEGYSRSSPGLLVAIIFFSPLQSLPSQEVASLTCVHSKMHFEVMS